MSDHMMFAFKYNGQSFAITLDKVTDFTVRYMLDTIDHVLLGADMLTDYETEATELADQIMEDNGYRTFEFEPLGTDSDIVQLIEILSNSPKRPHDLSPTYFEASVNLQLATITSDDHIDDVIEPLINAGWICHATQDL